MKPLAYLPFMALLALLAIPTAAQDTVRISDLSYIDNQYMQQQRDNIDDLANRNFGNGFNGDTKHDIGLLQQILDRKVVRPDQTPELQAMGIILGDLLANDLDLHWVIYADKLGRTRALRYRQTEAYLFPVTMISRRREVDNLKSVESIYQQAYDIMVASKPPLPFR
jgi:uncharacterized protein DUF3806